MKGQTLADMAREAYERGGRLVAPLMGFPGVELINSNIKLAQQNYGEHYLAIRALAQRFQPDLIFPLMDLSVEANALGRYTIFPREDSATVPKEPFDMAEIERMAEVNISFDSRLMGYLETIKLMSIGLPKEVMRGAYVVGPYSLAALLMGADDAVMATILRPADLHRLCDFTTEKIQEVAQLLIAAGAEVICILEPSAVMLGPEQFVEFSASYIHHITTSCRYSGINTIYHTCGDTMHLVRAMAESGVNGVSLDSRDVGVDLPRVAEMLPDTVAIIGNINPTNTMMYGSPEGVRREVGELLDAMRGCANFILSTGCDLPQETPLANIAAFMEEGRRVCG